MFDYTYRLLKKVIKEENEQIEVELYNNQLKNYDGDEDKKPVVLVDFKKTTYDFAIDKAKAIEADFSLFFISDMEAATSSAHLEFIDNINQRLYAINKKATLENDTYYYSTLLQATDEKEGTKVFESNKFKDSGEITIGKLFFQGEVDTARTKDFAYDSLRVNALNYKAFLHFAPKFELRELDTIARGEQSKDENGNPTQGLEMTFKKKQ